MYSKITYELKLYLQLIRTAIRIENNVNFCTYLRAIFYTNKQLDY